MTYANTHRKTVLVLNIEFAPPMLLNAAGHALLGLVGKSHLDAWNLLPYPCPAFHTESQISEYPVVVLRAKRSSQLEKLIQQLALTSLPYNVFMDAMIGQTAEQQQQSTRDAQPGCARILCVALFGDEESIRPLIKSFSVYKASDANSAETTGTTPQA